MQTIQQIIKKKVNTTDKKSPEKTSSYDTISLNQAKRHFLNVAKSIHAEFQIDNENKSTIEALLLYALQAQDFVESGHQIGYDYSLSKGIFLTGNIGSGKTELMRILLKCQFPCLRFGIVSTRDIAGQVLTEGYDMIQRYGKKAINYRNQEPILCHNLFDDLGSEDKINHFGNHINVMEQIILDRYEQYKRHGLLTHFTSNLDLEQIREIYGDRVHSRLHEMCNFLLLGGSAESRDRRIENAKRVSHEKRPNTNQKEALLSLR